MRRTAGVCAVLLLILSSAVVVAAEPATQLVSVSGTGTLSNGNSQFPVASGDGRYIAFQSVASNLVSGDSNGVTDVFVRDLETSATERVSVSTEGTQSNGHSASPAISADGRYVAFKSLATNLVDADTNWTWDIFVRDRQTGTTERVSVGPDGAQSNGVSEWPSISADGRFVAFASEASNLVSGGTSGRRDVFVRDRTNGVTERVSIAASGSEAIGSSDQPSISGDGRFVAFRSYAGNLVPDDTNGTEDIFLKDRGTGRVELVSVSSGGQQVFGSSERPSVSAGGRYVAFQSRAGNLVDGDTNGSLDVFLRDVQGKTTERVSLSSAGAQGEGDSQYASLSADGRKVSFQSSAANLVANDSNGSPDVFVRDLASETTELATVSSSGDQGTRGGGNPSLSADGQLVAFESMSSNLVAADTNSKIDVFARSLGAQDTVPPMTAADLSGTSGKHKWFTSAVEVKLSATDEGGSGVKEITYGVQGAQNIQALVVAGSSVTLTIEAEGKTTVKYYARDNAGNTERERSVEVWIDMTPPVIAVTAPVAGSYLLGSTVQASYQAEDPLSGVAACSGAVVDGSVLDTSSPGARTFEVEAEDNAGNVATQLVSFEVGYGVLSLDGKQRTVKAGAVLPVKLQLVDAGGANLSSPAIELKVEGVEPGAEVGGAGKSNEEGAFRYDVELGDGGGYLFNLSTRGLEPGEYALVFTVDGDPTRHLTTFQVR